MRALKVLNRLTASQNPKTKIGSLFGRFFCLFERSHAPVVLSHGSDQHRHFLESLTRPGQPWVWDQIPQAGRHLWNERKPGQIREAVPGQKHKGQTALRPDRKRVGAFGGYRRPGPPVHASQPAFNGHPPAQDKRVDPNYS